MLVNRLIYRCGIARNLICYPTCRYYSPVSLIKVDLEHYRKMAPKHREDPVIMKLDSDEFKSIFTDELDTLSNLFKKYGYEIRIAGGAVRDLLSGNRPKDLDFATTATPEDMKTMFTKEEVRMINPNGEKHGTITPRINDKENFEVTTLRIDVVTDGRHAEVQYTTDWLLDANRRDLTINSMFLGLDGSVYDYFYGYDDLKNRRVAFVGNAVTRIQEDFLRILRYFRFYGRIAEHPDNHDEVTLTAIKENASGLAQISGERIWVELKKMLEGNFDGQLLKKIIDCNCASYIGLPEDCNHSELDRLINECGENNLHPITWLSALITSLEQAMALNARLKFSVYDRDLLLFLVSHRKSTCDIRLLHPYKCLAIKSKNKNSKEYIIELLKYMNSPHVQEFEQWELPKMPVTGSMLKEQGVEAGAFMGEVLQELRNFWVDHDFNLSAEQLLNKLPTIVEELKNKRKNKKAKH